MIHGNDFVVRRNDMSFSEQMANISSEVGRAIRAKEQGLSSRMRHAIDRMLKLIDLTRIDVRLSSARRRELGSAREVLCDFLVGDNEYNSTGESLDKYFTIFCFARYSAV